MAKKLSIVLYPCLDLLGPNVYLKPVLKPIKFNLASNSSGDSSLVDYF